MDDETTTRPECTMGRFKILGVCARLDVRLVVEEMESG